MKAVQKDPITPVDKPTKQPTEKVGQVLLPPDKPTKKPKNVVQGPPPPDEPTKSPKKVLIRVA